MTTPPSVTYASEREAILAAFVGRSDFGHALRTALADDILKHLSRVQQTDAGKRNDRDAITNLLEDLLAAYSNPDRDIAEMVRAHKALHGALDSFCFIRQPDAGKWVAFSEKWPENDGLYWGYSRHGWQGTVMTKHRLIYVHDDELDEWTDNCDITHWMPLPEPPTAPTAARGE